MKGQIGQRSLLAGIALTVLLIDLFSKELAAGLLANGTATTSPSFLGGFHLLLARNQGAAGGLWLGDNTRFINVASMFLVMVLAAMVSRQLAIAHKLAPVALGLIMGAAAGNTLSLLMSPSVVDFIAYDVGASDIIFNVADIALVAGIVALAPITFSLAVRIRSTMGDRASLPLTIPLHARATRATHKPSVFEREVPIAFASEIAPPRETEDRLPVERTVVTEQRITPNADLRAP